MTVKPNAPLAGIRIIEIDAIGPVPLAGMILADLGADVIRVARPASAGVGAWSDVGGDILHRNRRVVHLNLKEADARASLLDLVEGADGLIEGYRPGVMERLALGPDVCLARNPKLVFGRMTGWGQTGPLALRAGHDINYLAITGALHAIGDRDAPPTVPLNLVGDYGGGAMFLIAGLLAGLLSAKSTGHGQVVDASITDGVPVLMSLFHAWLPKDLWIDAPHSNLLDGAAPFYRCYRCADGRHVAVGCLEPQFFGEMMRGLGLDEARYDQNDRERWPALEQAIAAALATRGRDEWADHFAGTDACVSPVLSLTEAPIHPHNVARATFSSRAGTTHPAPAPRFSRFDASIEHGRDVDLPALLESWRER